MHGATWMRLTWLLLLSILSRVASVRGHRVSPRAIRVPSARAAPPAASASTAVTRARAQRVLAQDDNVNMDAPTAQRRRSSRPGPGRPRNSHATGAAHYLGKLAPTPLLTAEEELSLARSLQRLLELRRLHEELEEELKRRPSAGEVAASLGLPAPEVVRQLREGEAARERMLVANLRLVVSIAKRFMGKGLPFDDLVQEGNLGLIRAAEGFDPVRRLKFSTYATYWIRQRICRAIADQSRVIRIPAYLHDRLLAMRRESDKFQALTGRVPTDSELANLIGVKDAKFSDMHLIPSVVSMEARLNCNEDDGRTIDTVLTDTVEQDTMLDTTLLRAELESVLTSELPPLERDVLRLRYGLDDGVVKSMVYVGKIAGLKPIKVRALERTAMRRLQQPDLQSRLKDFRSLDV